MLQVALIEAFADKPCQGNGAAVVLLKAPLGDPLLQGLATSLNQSETAFLWFNNGHWMLRWFTPHQEVPLCGHATLAACVALAHWGHLDPLQTIPLFSRSGPLLVQCHQPPFEQTASTADIHLPCHGLIESDCPEYLTALLKKALGQPPNYFWRSKLGYSVVLVEAQANLEGMASLADQLRGDEAQGLVVMQASETNSARTSTVIGRVPDYQLRFFAPGLGIPEDPVTGSAHALVAPYWMQVCAREDVVGWQCSPRPGGMVCKRIDRDTIQLKGSAYLLLEGSINLESKFDNFSNGSCRDPLEKAESGHIHGWGLL